MTTILYDPKTRTMVADRKMSDDNGFETETLKIRRLKNGGLYAACGLTAAMELVFAWVDNDYQGPCPAMSESSAIVVSPSGRIWLAEPPGALIPIRSRRVLAIGSGSNFALGALDAGADMVEAVKIACRRDKNSGGRPQVMRL
jgi:hypothetical protein